jgi:hypothetical protein
MKQALSYTAEHLDSEGTYIFELFAEEINIIHVKLRSRHFGSVVHDIWIKYDSSLKLSRSQDPVRNWYCTCKSGARVFGLCAHVTSILWFLGVAIHDSNLTKQRKCDLFKNFVIDCKIKTLYSIAE